MVILYVGDYRNLKFPCISAWSSRYYIW